MDYYAGDLDYVEDIFDFKGMYEIISKDGLTIIDGVREENGTLYREEIEIYSEDNFNVNKKEKIAQLEEKAVIFKDFLFENYENIEVLQYTQEEVILKYKNKENLYKIKTEEDDTMRRDYIEDYNFTPFTKQVKSIYLANTTLFAQDFENNIWIWHTDGSAILKYADAININFNEEIKGFMGDPDFVYYFYTNENIYSVSENFDIQLVDTNIDVNINKCIYDRDKSFLLDLNGDIWIAENNDFTNLKKIGETVSSLNNVKFKEIYDIFAITESDKVVLLKDGTEISEFSGSDIKKVIYSLILLNTGEIYEINYDNTVTKMDTSLKIKDFNDDYLITESNELMEWNRYNLESGSKVELDYTPAKLHNANNLNIVEDINGNIHTVLDKKDIIIEGKNWKSVQGSRTGIALIDENNQLVVEGYLSQYD